MFRLIGVFFLLLPLLCAGQYNKPDSVIRVPMLSVSYSFQLPAADMAKRFRANSNMGVHFLWKTRKNFLWGAEWNMFFGKSPRETEMFDSIKTSNGNIIDRNGEYALIRLYQRGHTATLRIGKLFPLSSRNRNSGLFFLLSAGYIQHKIRIDEIGRRTPQLNPDYKKGYDRLTSGFLTGISAGYLLITNSRYFNGFVAAELWPGFTQSRRSYNFDTMSRDTQKRLDILYGFRIGFILPLYPKVPNEFYYN
jgi:hypothetical protein